MVLEQKLELSEKNKAIKWVIRGFIYGLLTFLLTIPFITSLGAFIRYGVSKPVIVAVEDYWALMLSPLRFIDWHLNWFASIKTFPFWPTEIIVSFLLGVLVVLWKVGTNPHTFLETTFGNARFARDDDIKNFGLLDGWIIVVGEWKKKLLRMTETLSVLCVAPPGTGKTVAIVVPTILTCDKVSMIVNDVKPELADLTSGYRSKHSICLRLEWAAMDRPEEGIFYPRWNPLSPLSMPPRGPNRDLYVDRLCSVLIEEPKGNADPHWTNKARATLNGFIHYITSKCEARNYQGLPKQWVGKEPCIAMLLDWITEATLSAADKIEQMKKVNPSGAMFADPIKDMMMEAVKEARQHGYDQRCILEMTQLANTPDKERGSVLSTMDGGLNVFKNSAVRARTSRSDFSFEDVRGLKDPTTGEVKPMTIYVCVNQEDALALGRITGLLVEALSAWLVAHKPGAMTRTGNKVGPYPALFVLDEFPQMPKLRALIDGPAVGRGQKVSYLMIGQDLGQITAKYGKDETETVISTTAAKVVLPQNNEVTAKRFSEMVGQRTVESRSRSRTIGLSKENNPFAHNLQRSLQGQPLLRPEDFMSIEKGKHYVLFQSNMNRPIKADTPMYFKHPELKHLVDPKHGGKYPPAPPMPEFMRQRRLAEWQAEQEQAQNALRGAAAE